MTDDLPITWTQRIRDEETAERFKDASDRLEKINRKYGKNATGLFLINLGLQKLDELEELEARVKAAAPE